MTKETKYFLIFSLTPIVAFILLILLFCSMVIIPVGYAGIETLGGIVNPNALKSGWYFLNPFSSVDKINLKTQLAEEEGVIPSQEMLNMHLKTAINYHLEQNNLINLYREVGANYYQTLVEPHIKSSIRQITSEYKAEQLFSAERDVISKKIQKSLIETLEPKGIIIESVMLKEIGVPMSLQKAIELKQSHQQEAEGMEFKLKKEKLEAERKRIEAQGIQEFQEIVKKGINKDLLTWKGIEATQALAQSNNTKIVIFGNKDTGGLPLILSDK